LCHGNFSLT